MNIHHNENTGANGIMIDSTHKLNCKDKHSDAIERQQSLDQADAHGGQNQTSNQPHIGPAHTPARAREPDP